MYLFISSAYYIILFVKWVWRNTFGELCGLCCKRKADSSESLDEHGDAKVMLLGKTAPSIRLS